jgi:phage baseplate assembly protein W
MSAKYQTGTYYNKGFTGTDINGFCANLDNWLTSSPSLGGAGWTSIMRSKFGSSFLKSVFEPNDAILQSKITHSLTDSIRRYEPRVDRLLVSVSPSNKDVDVTISYTILESGERVNDYLSFVRQDAQSVTVVR